MTDTNPDLIRRRFPFDGTIRTACTQGENVAAQDAIRNIRTIDQVTTAANNGTLLSPTRKIMAPLALWGQAIAIHTELKTSRTALEDVKTSIQDSIANMQKVLQDVDLEIAKNENNLKTVDTLIFTHLDDVDERLRVE